MSLKSLIARTHCHLFGHRRGKRITGERAVTPYPRVTYACPRCGAQWSRKVAK